MSRSINVLICLVFAAVIIPRAGFGSPGLIGHWKFDETAGSTAHDDSGNDFHGIIEERAVWEPDGGRVDGARYFDGIRHGVRIPFRPQFNLTTELTIAAWVRQADLNNGWILIRNKADDSHRLYGLFAGDLYTGISFHYYGAGGGYSVA